MTVSRIRNIVNTVNPGLAPKLSGAATDFLDGTGAYSVPAGSGGGFSPWPSVTPPPAAAGFSATNGGSSTLVDDGDKLVFFSPANASADSIHVWTISAPATPYVLTAMFVPTMSGPTGSVFSFLGILFRESGTGKIVTMNCEASGTCTPFGFDVMEWTNATTFSARQASVSARFYSPVVFLRIENTGALLNYSYSYDGINYTQLASTALNDFFTTGPDQIGLGGYCFVTADVAMSIGSWDVS